MNQPRLQPKYTQGLHSLPINMRFCDVWLLLSLPLHRYLVIGIYVGAATVAGFIWWFVWFEVRGAHSRGTQQRSWQLNSGLPIFPAGGAVLRLACRRPHTAQRAACQPGIG